MRGKDWALVFKNFFNNLFNIQKKTNQKTNKITFTNIQIQIQTLKNKYEKQKKIWKSHKIKIWEGILWGGGGSLARMFKFSERNGRGKKEEEEDEKDIIIT